MHFIKAGKLIAPIMAAMAFVTASSWVSAETLRVAVASNFSKTLQEVASQFERETGHTVKLSSASTGKLYAQIVNGAPFDLFFAADAYRPELIAQQRSNGEQAKTYAYGRLVFITYTENAAANSQGSAQEKSQACLDKMLGADVKRLAIANPVTAPYGLATKETLESLALWEKVKDKIVMGENISQTLHFLDSQNAQAGFVAKSQLFKHDINNTCQWDVPEQHHAKIEQKMIKLKPQNHSVATDAFYHFMSSPQAFKIIKAYGYDVPVEGK